MNLCLGTTGWSLFFSICEIIPIIILGFYYTKNIYFIYKNEQEERYEFLDWILIYLSTFQIYLMLFSLILGFYFGFTLILEIFKFSQNFLISGILLYQILIWHKYVVTYDIVKYFIVALCAIDFISLIIGLNFEFSFSDVSGCRSDTVLTLVCAALCIDILIISFAVYKNLEEKSDSKSLNILVEDQHNLNDLIQRFATNIKKMKKYYLIIVIAFTLSYFVDLYFNVFMHTYKIDFEEIGILNNKKFENLNQNLNNSLTINNSSNFSNNTILNLHANETNLSDNLNYTINNGTCYSNTDFGEYFSFKEYLVCSISFFFRDLGPHIYIFLALFIYKPNINSRSSSFIELI
jgi:hypothetical protein